MTVRSRCRSGAAIRAALGAAALAALVPLAGCASSAHRAEATFQWRGTSLTVVKSFANTPVSFTASAPGEVDVVVTTSTAGRSAATPAWTLTGDTLELGTPCSQGYVGLCEPSYTVSVPHGTRVTLDGVTTTVG